MARPVGSTSRWWKNRVRIGVYLYNPTQENIELLKQTVRALNETAKAKAAVGLEYTNKKD